MDSDGGRPQSAAHRLEDAACPPVYPPVLRAVIRHTREDTLLALPPESILFADPALSAQLLRRFSAEWFSTPIHVPAGRTLVERLGSFQYQSAALAHALASDAAAAAPDPSLESAWRKAVRRSVLAHALAAWTKEIAPLDAMATGLLWDIGRLAERTLAGGGGNPAAPGAALCDAWRLPECIGGALRLAGLPLDGLYGAYTWAPLAELVSVADAAADPSATLPDQLPPGALGRLGLTLGSLDEARSGLQERVAELLAPLGMQGESEPLEAGELEAAAARLLQEAGRIESAQRQTRRSAAAQGAVSGLLEAAAVGANMQDLVAEIARAAQEGLGVSPGLCCVPEPGGPRLLMASWRDGGHAPRVTAVEAQKGSETTFGVPGPALQALGLLGVGIEETGWQVAAPSPARWEGLAALPMTAAGRCWGQLFLDTGMEAASAESSRFSEWASFARKCGSAIAWHSRAAAAGRQQEILLERLRRGPSAETAAGTEPGDGAFAGLAVRALKPALDRVREAAQSRRMPGAADDDGNSVLREVDRVHELLQAVLDATHPPARGNQTCELDLALREVLESVERMPDPPRLHVALSGEIPLLQADPGALRRMLRYALDCVLPGEELWVRTQPQRDGNEVAVTLSAEHGVSKESPPHAGIEHAVRQAAAQSIAKSYGGSCVFGQSARGGIEAAVSLAVAAGKRWEERGTHAGQALRAVAPEEDSSGAPMAGPESEPTPAAPVGLDADQPPTVLVVDDDGSVRSVLRSALQERGCRVLTAESTEEGLRHMADARVDLVLLDTECGGAGGAAPLLAELRILEDAPPAVAMLPADRPELHDHALRSGFQACVAKPFQLRTLIALAEAALAGTMAS